VLGLCISQAQQPYCRPPTPVLKEVTRQQRCKSRSVRVAIVVSPPPTVRRTLLAWRLEQLAKEGLGSLDQHSASLSVDCVTPPLEHLLLEQRPHLRHVAKTLHDFTCEPKTTE
jgi:hypothetical protein